jgi:ribosome recycling factor
MRRLQMAQDNMVLFAKKLKLESKWNELFLENRGQITPEMSVLGDEIKVVIRSIIRRQEEEVHSNSRDGEIHLYAG